MSKMPNLYPQTHQKTRQALLGQIPGKHSRRKTRTDITIFIPRAGGLPQIFPPSSILIKLLIVIKTS